MIKRICEICGKEFEVWESTLKYRPARFCSKECQKKSLIGVPRSQDTKKKLHFAHLGEKNHNWKGGRTLHRTGYFMIKQREHPYSPKSGYIFEHRLIMEKKLGRYLTPNEVVHHFNGIRTDNREENLMVMPKGKHHWSLVVNEMRKKIVILEKQLANARR